VSYRESASFLSQPRNGQKSRVLTVGHSEDTRLLLHSIFGRLGWTFHAVDSCRHAMQLLQKGPIPVVISAEYLPDGDWKSLLRSLASLSPRPELIVFCDRLDDELWAEVLNLGGYDVILSPLNAEEVAIVSSLAARSPGLSH